TTRSHPPFPTRRSSDLIMHQHYQIVLPIPGHVRNHRLAGFRQIAAAATESPLFENLPPVRRHQFVIRVKYNQIKVIPRRFKEDRSEEHTSELQSRGHLV